MNFTEQVKVNVSEFKDSDTKDWDEFLKQKKIKQAFAKLEELGYYHDSGLYGWLREEDKFKGVRDIQTQEGVKL